MNKREILFKAKSTKNDWIKGCYTSFRQNVGYISNNDVDLCEVDTNTLCQFTGLVDISGSKIFEGDIIRNTMDEEYTVIFDDGCFYADDSSCQIQLSELCRECDIVGNIYNKE